MTPEELVKEMSATRKAIAYYLGRLSTVEAKVDKITTEREHYWKDQQARRREKTW